MDSKSQTGKATRVLATAAMLALLVASLSGGIALAAKGGSGKPGGGSTSSATLVPSCNPCAAGAVVHFSGSGYDASQYKALLSFAGATTTTPVWSGGTISHDWPYFSQAGSYLVQSYQWAKNGSLVLKAQVTVVVQ